MRKSESQKVKTRVQGNGEENKEGGWGGGVGGGLDGGIAYSTIRGQLQSVSPWDSHLNAWTGFSVYVYYGPVAISSSAICLLPAI